ncbi:MAG: riboflavin synthase [Candidatus Magasanikbacteria bacterium]
MFTGIIEDTTEVVDVSPKEEGVKLKLNTTNRLEELKPGASLAVSGACLTIEELDQECIELFLSKETLEKTWFSDLEVGDKLNIETPLAPSDPMGGHIVQGHVEADSQIIEIEDLGEGWNFTFDKPEQLEQYIVNKGFIAVEGISLTIAEDSEHSFTATIIPETWSRTNLSDKNVGDKVNIETDVTAGYIEKMMEK